MGYGPWGHKESDTAEATLHEDQKAKGSTLEMQRKESQVDVMRGLVGVEQLERRVQLAGGCWGPSTERCHQGYRGPPRVD